MKQNWVCLREGQGVSYQDAVLEAKAFAEKEPGIAFGVYKLVTAWKSPGRAIELPIEEPMEQ